MKVQVNLKLPAKTEANQKVDLVVNSEDTVLNVKERIASSQMVAFPDQDLLLNGKILDEHKTLAEYGIKEGSALHFAVNASEESLVQQLTELLQARDLTCDELGLLYCYKHSVSVNQALKTVGHVGKLIDFVKSQKGFAVENGKVALIRCETSLKPFSVSDEVKQILEENNGRMDITSLCSKFVQKFNVSIASVVDMRPAEFFAKEKDQFVVVGRSQVALKSVAIDQQSQQRDMQQHSQRPQVQERRVAEPTPVRRQSDEQVVQEAPEAEAVSDAVDSQQYLDLHTTISGRSFNSKVAQILNDIVEVVTEKSFLNISHVVKSGSVGKGTAVAGTTDAELVFFLKGLPAGKQHLWLPALLKAAAGVLTEHLDASHGVEDICTTADSVHMNVKGLVEMHLRFSPAFESYSDAVQAMGEQGPESRKHFATSLAKEKVEFIAKQPGQVKVTMRLLKWWRNQQEWSYAMAQPSDELLELISVYSALQTKPKDQRVAIANVMSLMARFDELRIVWSNYYGKDEIWSPLLQHRPLLMDPVNPFVNVADPQVFDPRELMSHARTTHFFW